MLTGGQLPAGADCALALEDVLVQDGRLVLTQELQPGLHVCQAGCDIKVGSRIVRCGEDFTPAVLATLAVSGIMKVEAHVPPKTAVLAIGNELAALDGPEVMGRMPADNLLLASGLLRLRGLANQAALAIAKMRLFEQVSAGREHMRALSQALVEIQETERRNLALELHDELGQVLSAAKLSLDMFPTLPKPAADKQLQFVRSMLGELVGRVRRMALDLRPSMLDDLGLLPALAWLFENYQSQSGEGVTFLHQDLEQRFSPQVEITAYRIIQESLTNVMRHAGNGRVEVNARADGQALYLQIRDFGTGFDPATALSGTLSSGLSGMRERIRMLGGEMAIDSAPGKGTCLTARLPLVLIHDSSA